MNIEPIISIGQLRIGGRCGIRQRLRRVWIFHARGGRALFDLQPVYPCASYGGDGRDARLAPSARIVLSEPLVGGICIAIKIIATPKQIGKLVYIRFGRERAEFLPVSSAAIWYRFNFVLNAPEGALEIEPTAPARPSQWDRRNRDPRKIGLGLIQLVITKGACVAD